MRRMLNITLPILAILAIAALFVYSHSEAFTGPTTFTPVPERSITEIVYDGNEKCQDNFPKEIPGEVYPNTLPTEKLVNVQGGFLENTATTSNRKVVLTFDTDNSRGELNWYINGEKSPYAHMMMPLNRCVCGLSLNFKENNSSKFELRECQN